MLGNFSYHNPTKLYFGDDALRYLNEELPKYGKTVQLIYGGGSIKRNGLYDEIIAILKANGKTVVEDAGVMPNPTVDKLREGVRLARENKVDFLLAVGGGSCGSMLAEVAAAGCDTFVTADLKYNMYLDAREMGINLMDAGHFATENVVCAPGAEFLQRAFPELSVSVSKEHREVYGEA